MTKHRRSPYGERGLKYHTHHTATAFPESLSLRRAWIEIVANVGNGTHTRVALLTESVD